MTSDTTTTAGPNTSTSQGSNVSGTMSASDATTGADTEPVTTSTTSGTGETSSSTTEPGTTGPVCDLESAPDGFNTCQEDADCELAGDCCSCVAFNPDMGSPGNCGGGCMQNKCEEWGLSEAVCDQGECAVKAKSCDQTAVECDAPEPNCPEGHLPQVDDGCYTGACLPIEACDWVPDCSFCGGPVPNCKITQGEAEDCAAQVCFADFPECFGAQSCACLGPIFCAPPFTTCTDIGPGVISCS